MSHSSHNLICLILYITSYQHLIPVSHIVSVNGTFVLIMLLAIVVPTLNKNYFLSHLISSYLILSHLISSHLISSHLISSHLILSYLMLSYLILSYLILSYLILNCRPNKNLHFKRYIFKLRHICTVWRSEETYTAPFLG